jgi:hypothetical protein
MLEKLVKLDKYTYPLLLLNTILVGFLVFKAVKK